MMNEGFDRSNEITGPMIEKSFQEGITLLERHFQSGEANVKCSRFLLGES